MCSKVSPNASSADKEGLKKLKEKEAAEKETEKPAEGSEEKPGEANGATTSENAKEADEKPAEEKAEGEEKKADEPAQENRGCLKI